MLVNHILENVPHYRFLLLDHFLGLLDGGAVPLGFELVIDEGLEKLERHCLRETALIELELGANDDDGTARVVHALAEEVLPETALLALERIAQGLERAVVGAPEDAAAAAVVEEGVNGFLEHALFIAHDAIRPPQLHDLLQPALPAHDPPLNTAPI